MTAAPCSTALTALVLSIFDRYPFPAQLAKAEWLEARRELARRLDLIGIHAVKFAKDVPEPFAESYFALMPIHEKLRGHDYQAIRNYLRVTACNIHAEFEKRADIAGSGSGLAVLREVIAFSCGSENCPVANAGSATPLIALDAVVFDTETTGLDPRKARLVEIGAISLVGGRLQDDASFRRLVNPGEPIPAVAARIHGIDDAAVADAPEFRELWPEVSSLLQSPVLIGHSIGFDLAVLKKECGRAGIPWPRPRML